jgi:type II secretory pathway pseudopilin PulG
MKTSRYTPRDRQQGMTLVIGLIMLIMISLAAVASYNMARTSLDVVGNMQFRNEAVASADSAIQEAISTVRFFQTPGTIFLNPCENTNNLRCYDLNRDGTTDIRVQLRPPVCVKARPKPNAELDLATIVPGEVLPRDAACAAGVGQQFGIVGAPTGNSQCADSTWEIVADVTDAVSSARITVTQGVDVRVSTEDVGTSCPGA